MSWRVECDQTKKNLHTPLMKERSEGVDRELKGRAIKGKDCKKK